MLVLYLTRRTPTPRQYVVVGPGKLFVDTCVRYVPSPGRVEREGRWQEDTVRRLYSVMQLPRDLYSPSGFSFPTEVLVTCLAWRGDVELLWNSTNSTNTASIFVMEFNLIFLLSRRILYWGKEGHRIPRADQLFLCLVRVWCYLLLHASLP